MIGKEFLGELRAAGYKFTEADIIFVTHDATSRLVWLETGNESAGLKHIILHHAADYKRALGLDETQIAGFLYQVVTYGTVVRNDPAKVGGGYNRVYDYHGNYYIFSGLGKNGFIVTAYPASK